MFGTGWTRCCGGYGGSVEPDTSPHASLVPPVERAEATSRRSYRLRVALVVVLVLIVGSGLLNVFGVRTTTTSSSSGPLRVDVEHASVARAGLAAPLTITLRHDDGFGGEPVHVAITSDYMSRFDENGLDPDPDDVITDDRMLHWTWEAVDGDVIVVDFDARIEPTVHWGFSGEVEVRAAGETVTVPIRTWIAP